MTMTASELVARFVFAVVVIAIGIAIGGLIGSRLGPIGQLNDEGVWFVSLLVGGVVGTVAATALQIWYGRPRR